MALIVGSRHHAYLTANIRGYAAVSVTILLVPEAAEVYVEA